MSSRGSSELGQLRCNTQPSAMARRSVVLALAALCAPASSFMPMRSRSSAVRPLRVAEMSAEAGMSEAEMRVKQMMDEEVSGGRVKSILGWEQI